jgi:hypothetical protein
MYLFKHNFNRDAKYFADRWPRAHCSDHENFRRFRLGAAVKDLQIAAAPRLMKLSFGGMMSDVSIRL